MKRAGVFLPIVIALLMCLAACTTEPAVTTDDTTAKPEKTAVVTPPITAPVSTSNIEYRIRDNVELFRWDFTQGSNSDWRSSNALKRLTFDEGYLKAEITAIDPHMSTTRLPVELICEDIDYIVLEICNQSSSMAAQIFFMTEDAPSPSEANSFAISYSDSGEENEEWETIYLLTGNNGWHGKLTSFRFDVSNGSSGTVMIKSIAFLKAV